MENDPQNQGEKFFQSNDGQLDARTLRTVQYLLIIAAVLCPISIFFGGVLFSGAAVVCSAIAFAKILKLSRKEGPLQTLAKKIWIASIICLCACALIFTLNVIAAIIMYPIILEAVQTGDYSSLGLDSGSSGGSSEGNNTFW